MTRLVQLAVSAALLVLVPGASGAADVCGLEHAALNATVEKEAAAIADYYQTTARQLSLNEGGTAKKTHPACNWECGSDAVITPLQKGFGFLQYHCRNTTAPASTRRPTGSGTKSQMGLSIPDDEYRDAADAIFSGDLMKVPPSLEAASKSGKVQDLIDAVNAISGASWLKFSSTSVDNDNEGAARILIHVPDSEETPRFEQWIQIAIKDGGGLGRNVDFIARRIDTDPQEVAFRGYSRTSGGFVPEGGSSRSELSKCYSCHPSGLRPIVPATEGTKAEGGKPAIEPEGTMLVGADLAEQLAHVKSITSHRAIFGPTGYVVSENGPHFGPSSRSGRAEFVAAGCGASLDEARRQAVVEQMDCEMCHDGSDRGVLNAGTSRITIFHKVAQNMEAPMPPGVTDSLSQDERKILFQCLKDEYAEMLREWLTSDLLMTLDE